ncbi:MAG: S8 family serine peptidase, partial [Lysobacterales bacterium]
VGLCPDGTDRQSGAGAAESGIPHGVMTAGIITSTGTVSSPGIAPDAKIVAIKVLDNTLPAGEFKFFSNVLAALDFIINNPSLGIDIINMSFATGPTFAGDCDNANANTIAAANAINTLRASGVIAFASSGNNGSGTQMALPACIANVISVGATDDADNVHPLTNSNANLELMAPGVNITSTGLGNGTATDSGTSFASPHAAGCAALLIESGVAVTPDQIETYLEASTVTVTDSKNGLTFPRLDCSPAAGNIDPTAVDDGSVTNEDTPVLIDVLANDSDSDGGTLAVNSTTTPANGSVAINAGLTVTYTPNADFNGADSFTYTVIDGQGGSATATVDVT